MAQHVFLLVALWPARSFTTPVFWRKRNLTKWYKTGRVRRAQFVMECARCALFTGCAGEKTRSSGEKSADEQLLRVLKQVYDGEWKVTEEIAVKRDGSYQITVYRIFETKPTTATVDGHLPDSLMQSLRADVVNKRGFQVVASVPTYTFGIDDNHVRHPAGITKLLACRPKRTENVERKASIGKGRT